MAKKVAVVLFNLGGPDNLEAVKPFLFNLFNDPAIIGAPGPIRWLLAKFISAKRAPVAQEIYKHLGGGSPLVPLTIEQAEALKASLEQTGDIEAKVVLAMRYWHPFADEAARDVQEFGPEEIILLPLYPQYSSTTSGSSIKDWGRAASAIGLNLPTKTVCCYPTEPGWVKAQADLIKKKLAELPSGEKPRLMFSAHGLPKKVVADGDPYQWQVEQTAQAVIDEMNLDGLDWIVCYQSRVGPLEWIGPSTEDELQRAADDGVAPVITPIAFVSEHSETLVELDIEYRELAEELGIKSYHRVPAVATHPDFINGLASVVRRAVTDNRGLSCAVAEGRLCPAQFSRCPDPKPAGA